MSASFYVDAMNISILVMSCDAYRDIWHPFFHCFFKHWSDCPYPIYLASNDLQYPDPRVTTILTGSETDYSTKLTTAVNQIPHDWLIYWNEDRPLEAPVNTERLLRLIHLAQAKDAGYFKFNTCNPPALVDAGEEIGEIPKGTRYRVSMTICLWKKSALLKVLQAGESVWDIEKRGGANRANAIEDKFYALPIHTYSNPPLVSAHLVSKGKLMPQGVTFLKQEGLFHYAKERSRTSLWQNLYAEFYQSMWNLYYQMRWKLKKAGLIT